MPVFLVTFYGVTKFVVAEFSHTICYLVIYMASFIKNRAFLSPLFAKEYGKQ